MKYLNCFLYVIVLIGIICYFCTNESVYLTVSILFILLSNFTNILFKTDKESEIKGMTSKEIQEIKSMILANEKGVIVIKKLENIQI